MIVSVWHLTWSVPVRLAGRTMAGRVPALAGPAAGGADSVVACPKALHDAIAHEKTVVDGKIAAHHKGPHRRVLLRQRVGLVLQVGLVLAAVDEDVA